MKDSISIRSILTKLDTGRYLGFGGVDEAESDLLQLLESKAVAVDFQKGSDKEGWSALAIPISALNELRSK